MKYLAPSILSADFAILGEQIKQVKMAGCDRLHFDIMDGMFVPSISFGMPVLKCVRKATDLILDVHMMVVDPIRYIQDVRDYGADIISVHPEACAGEDEAMACLDKISVLGAGVAIAFSPDTPVSDIVPYLPKVEEVVLMSVYPGFGGQSFIEDSHNKIKELAALRESMGLDFKIEIDGGVNLNNAAQILDDGADILVAGSAVFNGSVCDNTARFLDIVRNK